MSYIWDWLHKLCPYYGIQFSSPPNIVSSHTYIGEGNGNPLQYSCLENPMEGGACRLKSMGLLRVDTTEQLHFHALGKEMATTPVFLPGESQGRGSLVGRCL